MRKLLNRSTDSYLRNREEIKKYIAETQYESSRVKKHRRTAPAPIELPVEPTLSPSQDTDAGKEVYQELVDALSKVILDKSQAPAPKKTRRRRS